MRFDIASWLTARRLRAHGIILALCLWSVFFWNVTAPGLRDRSGNLKGTDFLHLYTLGLLALEHNGADLYDMQAQSALAARRVPQAAGIRYLPLYPPQVSIFFTPLARLPYAAALTVWLVFNSLLYAACVYAIWRACPNLHDYKSTVVIAAAAFPAFWHLLLWGQTSALALVCFTLAFFAFRAQREFLAGVAIGCLIFKPQLALAAVIVFVVTLNWRLVAGALLSAAAQLAAGWGYYGTAPMRMWARVLYGLAGQLPLLEPRLYQTHCLRTFWSMLIPWPVASLALFIATALLVAALTVGCWRSAMPLALRYSALLLSTVLLAPHLTVYDLVLLAPAFLLLANCIVAQPQSAYTSHLELALYLAFVLPLLGPLARWTHFQLSVPAMAAALFWIWRLGENHRGGTAVLSTGSAQTPRGDGIA